MNISTGERLWRGGRLLLLMPGLAFAGTGAAQDTQRTDSPAAERFSILTQSPQQTVLHFGASDAWSMKRVGLWPEAEQRKIADWLFSMETDEAGKPKGIGLSVWRFNLGAGSEEQGDSAQINEATRTDCVLQADGTYDWTKQAGQRNFLRLAKERGVPHFLAFLNSAPVHFTKNGLATNTGRGGDINLREDCYDDFARYMAEALKGIGQRDGIRFDYLCPVNEPDGSWNWLGPKQEGSPATNREIARLVRETDKALTEHGMQTQIIVPESSDLRCLLGIHQTDWRRGNSISTFFSPDSTATFLGGLKHVPHLIVGHSYWTDTPVDFMRDIRIALRDTIRKYGLDYWQTEICIMSNDKEIGGGRGYDFSMKTALYVARVIHHDMVYANAKSWSWWRAVGADYRDGLVRAYSTDDLRTGWAADSKLLWAMGNFSRFVRPGAVRYDITAADKAGNPVAEGYNDPTGVMCSAYRNADGSWAVVAINYSENLKPFRFSTDDGVSRSWQAYRTSDISSESLTPVGTTDGQTVLPPRSVTTFVAQPVRPADGTGEGENGLP